MKVIVFDFDGTITYKSKNIWNLIWDKLGFGFGEGSVNDELYKKYRAGEYSYQTWCDITCGFFRERGLTRNEMLDETKSIKLIPGFNQTIQTLKAEGYKLYILSGSIIECIENVLGENTQLFDKIIANDFVFDENNLIKKIKTSPYDYEGKAVYIKKLIDRLGLKPSDVCFVGNGNNDEWVYTTGCNTVCINPDGANFKNKEIWHHCIEKSDDLLDLLPVIHLIDNMENENII